jgi:hypothetical protein
MPFIRSIAAVVTLGAFFLALMLVPNLSPHPWVIRLAAAVFVAALLAGYFTIVVSVDRQRAHDRQSRFQPGETVLTTAQPHKITVIAPAVILMLCGGVLLIMGVVLLAVHPNLNFTIPGHEVLNVPHKVTKPKHIHIAIWEIPVVLSLPLFYFVIAVWQRWKLTIWLVTNQNLLELRERSVVLPWLGSVKKPYPLNQVVDVEDDAGTFGGMFGWSTVTISIRLDIGQDAPTKSVFRFVPTSQNFTSLLRQISPALNGSSQSVILQHGSAAAITQPLPPTS